MKKHYAKVISDDFRWKNADDIDVYLASDVDAFMTATGLTNWATQAIRIADLELAAKENARYSTEMREEFERRGDRVARLELALSQIKNGCVDDDDKTNELFRLSPGELRKIAVNALAGVTS